MSETMVQKLRMKDGRFILDGPPMPLTASLTPTVRPGALSDPGDSTAYAMAAAEEACAAFGRLAAALVEKGVFTLDEALAFVDDFGEYQLVDSQG